MKLIKAVLSSASVLALAISAGSAQAFIVNISGTQYDITTFSGSYLGNGEIDKPKFNTFANGGVMPWWRDETLAIAFANAVGDHFGAQNLLDRGPYFAYGELEGIEVAFWDPNAAPAGVGIDWAQKNRTFIYAQAAPVSSVPGPLPLMGAAAAFGWSRKLRRRLVAPAPQGRFRL